MKGAFLGVGLATLAVAVCHAQSGERSTAIEHVKIYHEKGRYGGWPANHGIWSWGDEILVGFGRGYYKDLGERHHLDRDKPEEHLLARSLDGGRSWSIEDPSKLGALVPQGEPLLAQPVPGLPIPPATEFEGEIDFTHPDFAFVTSMYSIVPGQSDFFYSYDRGRTWSGPFRFPGLGLKSIGARTNYVVNGPKDCMVFLNGAEDDGVDRPFLAQTTDGGRSWRHVSWLQDKERGIMPSGVRLSPTELYAAVRRREGERGWISGYYSDDNGLTWTDVTDPAEDLGPGNPPMVLRLMDGRVCITYGDRRTYRICARISNDGGRSWGDEITLRGDGGSHDLGYTRSVQRPDGKVVTVYYFWDKTSGPERYIEAAIWEPKQ